MGTTLGLTRLCMLAAAFAAVTVNAPAAAADPQWPPAGVSFHGASKAPDISGLWLGSATAIPGQKTPVGNRGTADGRPPTFWAPWPLPYKPAYQAIFDERAEAAKKGRQLGDISARCLPFGMPWALTSKFYPDEIIQTPGQVTIFVNNTFPIVIWTDGRGHPKNLAPSYNGHSVGHWAGDTLVVDTVGILASTPLDTNRDPHSGQLNVKWTIRRVAQDVLHLHITLHDQDAFAEPVVTTNIWHRKTDPKWQVLDDASCFENNREASEGEDHSGFKKF
ncbi:MAG: hypothetical protein V4724_05980 [Pseudomonadota bacterium]